MKCEAFAKMLLRQKVVVEVAGNAELARELAALAGFFGMSRGDVSKLIDKLQIKPSRQAPSLLARTIAATAEVLFAASSTSAPSKDCKRVADAVAGSSLPVDDLLASWRLEAAPSSRPTQPKPPLATPDQRVIKEYVDRLRSARGAEALDIVATMKKDRRARHVEVQQVLISLQPTAKLAKTKATDLKALERYFSGERSRDAKDLALRS